MPPFPGTERFEIGQKPANVIALWRENLRQLPSSVAGLLCFLYNIAKGNWAGPPAYAPNPYYNPDQGPPKPLSFRGVLAACCGYTKFSTP